MHRRIALASALLLHAAVLALPFARSDIQTRPTTPLHVQLATRQSSDYGVQTTRDAQKQTSGPESAKPSPRRQPNPAADFAAASALPGFPASISQADDVGNTKPGSPGPERAAATHEGLAATPHASQGTIPTTIAPETPVAASNQANVPTINGVDYETPPAPTYPALAKRMRETGRTTLRVLVGIDGRPERVELHSSSGSEALDRAAYEATMRAIFRPYRESGKPVRVWTLVPIRFSLD